MLSKDVRSPLGVPAVPSSWTTMLQRVRTPISGELIPSLEVRVGDGVAGKEAVRLLSRSVLSVSIIQLFPGKISFWR